VLLTLSTARSEFEEAGVVIREAGPQELRNWDEIVTRFPNYRIFHKTSWIRSLEAFSGARALYLLFEKQGEIVGCLPGLLARIGWLRLFGSPREGWQTESMGPAFDPDRVSTRELVSALILFLEETYGVHHIELISKQMDADTMRELGFRGELLFTYRVPLFPGDEERAFKNMKKDTRTQVRKAIRLGLVARVVSEESFVDEFYDQAKEVFIRRGSSVPFSRNRALLCFRYMKNSGNLFAITIHLPAGDTCIATGIFLIEGRELVFWGWTHRAQYRWHCPSELLLWTAMKKGMEGGCTTFDMAGGGGAKLKFGAVPDERTYRWVRSRYGWLAGLRCSARKAYRWQQAFRGRIARWSTSRQKRHACDGGREREADGR